MPPISPETRRDRPNATGIPQRSGDLGREDLRVREFPRLFELHGRDDFLGLRVDHEGLVVVFNHDVVAVVGREVPGEGPHAVVLIVGIAHGDLFQGIAGYIAQFADDDLELGSVGQGLFVGFGLTLGQVRDQCDALGDVRFDFFIGKYQQFGLAPEVRRVEFDDVLFFQQSLEFAVELVQGNNSRRRSFGLVQVAVEVGLCFVFAQCVKRGGGAVEEVQVPGGSQALKACADVGIHFFALRCGEDVLGKAAGQRLGQIEIHKVAVECGGGDFVAVEELLVHMVHDVDVGIHYIRAAGLEAGLVQDDGVLVGSHGKSSLLKADGAPDTFNVRAGAARQSRKRLTEGEVWEPFSAD
ncbi:hypothetical protein AAur_3568 [Paenarthrobacter aurescens TC1]|uniref:Uncharacterized protein n=1 Tax=Paenarthrobacter aurescens (strain TC1) TaxID=290340 RepID=A1RAJ9_PAEAT|nr:hypothetical protein AAur_3568 [Paenarthrobacter aurescens TC1]